MQQSKEGFIGTAGVAFTENGGDARRGARTDGSRECSEAGNSPAEYPQDAETSSGGAAAPRFINRTYLNARYQFTKRDYGKGLVEIGWSFVSPYSPPKVAKGCSTERLGNEDRAVRRAKSRLRQLILSANLSHLLTLTYRENVTDFSRAVDDLNRFVRKVRRHHSTWVYVAVAEQQNRGAWHWHIAVQGRQDVELLRTLWREIVGEGNIDVSPPKGNRKDRRLLLVKYLCKYLGKTFETGQRNLNAHRFRASRNIQVPNDRYTLPVIPGRDVNIVVLQHLFEAAGTTGYAWTSGDGLSGWACSWK